MIIHIKVKVWLIVVAIIGLLVYLDKAHAQVTGARYFNTPDHFAMYNRSTWETIGYKLISSPYKYNVLNWEGVGGREDIGEAFMDQIKEAQQNGRHITMRITGGAQSMQAVAVCIADNVQWTQYGFLMFHRMSTTTGKVIMTQGAANDARRLMAPCVRRGIITQQDVEMVINKYMVYKYADGSTQYIKDNRKEVYYDRAEKHGKY